ncbi:ABC transporter ATP-binding protein [Proteiniclasticum sp. SCR006]|uniref:ABC transporter ATP-binding protein n=1 Tax=Proteiniclasticum aestuarii TaxID=2817862 RepID=A0A939HBA4_9CLOT|nr:ABC transporter ATP-binding protein [Proteiniclasticum aestuarii]MBO1264787.1 ABC transporter ATP-binding protein [Proteiniclasticum aestuarii]
MNKVYKKTFGLLLAALFVGLLSSGINGYMSLLMRDLVDLTFASEKPGFMGIALRLVFFAFVLFLMQTLLSVMKGYYRRKTNLNLKTYYLRGVFNKNINEFNRESTAKYVSHITNDLNTIDLDYIDGIFELALAFISFFVIIIVIGGINIEILGIILVVSVLMGFLSNALSGPVKKLFLERSGLYEKYTGYLSEVLGAFRIIRVNNLYDRIEHNFRDRSLHLQQKSYQIEKTSTFIYALQNFTINLTVLIVISVSVYYTILGKLSFGGVILILSNFQSLIGPFQRASELFPRIVSARNLFTTLDDSLKNRENASEHIHMEGFRERIELDGVSYAYGENRVLEEVNLSVRKNGKYLIVGPSGGGKSTLLKLLRKYFSPDRGRILVDGQNLSEITKESFFRSISNVEQQVFMFDDTLRNNLTLYRDITEEKLTRAIREAGLGMFVEKLPGGLDTVIEDNGRNISGGERSRIAIARALLNDSDILILDEAFQSLDYDTAREIERTILSLEQLTVLNVSHIIIKENRNLYNQVLYVDNRKVETLENA